MHYNRRAFLKTGGQLAIGLSLAGWYSCQNTETPEEDQATNSDMFFKLSLAQWSLHRHFQTGALDNLDFAKTAAELGFSGIEYVNQLFPDDEGVKQSYWEELKKRASDNGVESLLIMVDHEGDLGATDDAERQQTVENHYKWVDAAALLGCHSIRVNAAGKGTREEVAAAAADGLGRLAEHAAKSNINVLVENHGGYSSDGKWLSGIMAQVNMANCGTLPDFGNFCIEKVDGNCVEEYDRYLGMEELMPYNKGAVSAKAYAFDENGNETTIDYPRMLKILKDAGFSGYIGIEYEREDINLEKPGILATKALLEKVGKQLG